MSHKVDNDQQILDIAKSENNNIDNEHKLEPPHALPNTPAIAPKKK